MIQWGVVALLYVLGILCLLQGVKRRELLGVVIAIACLALSFMRAVELLV